MISLKVKGSYKNVMSWLERLKTAVHLGILDKYGKMGVTALSAATPVRTGLTASSWDYEIEHGSGSAKLIWTNSNVNRGFNIALGLQYGHGTGTGGYVIGTDYINPAITPIVEELAEAMWKEIMSL